MTAPLEGIKVLEVASWLAAPCCAALMADMGAEVVKVEPPRGDSYRRLYAGIMDDEEFIGPSFQFDNRGKRGIAIDLETTEGQELVRDLAKNADIFITNLTFPRLERYGLTDKEIHSVAPKAIYAVLAGYGTHGPDAERQAFDQSSFWARSGAMSVFGDRDDGPLIARGGYGDRTTGLNLLSSILAALRLRDKTDQGQYVEVTLQRTGIWALASDVNAALYDRQQPQKTSRKSPQNPIWNSYRTKDGRWIVLIHPMALAYLPKFCRAFGKDEWIDDPRFATLVDMAEHSSEIVPEIEEVFSKKDYDYWRSVLDNAGLIWEPVAELPEVVEDPALRERDAFSMIIHPKGGAMEIVSAPFHIRDAEISVKGPAPDTGEHTKEVLSDAGLSQSEINGLIEKKVVK